MALASTRPLASPAADPAAAPAPVSPVRPVTPVEHAAPDVETRRAIRRQLMKSRAAGQAPTRMLALAARFEARAARLAAEAHWVRQQVAAIYGPEGV